MCVGMHAQGVACVPYEEGCKPSPTQIQQLRRDEAKEVLAPVFRLCFSSRKILSRFLSFCGGVYFVKS